MYARPLHYYPRVNGMIHFERSVRNERIARLKNKNANFYSFYQTKYQKPQISTVHNDITVYSLNCITHSKRVQVRYSNEKAYRLLLNSLAKNTS